MVESRYYLYHNESDNSFSFIQDYQKHILVGFLRQDYFNAIKEQNNDKIVDYILNNVKEYEAEIEVTEIQSYLELFSVVVKNWLN